MVCPLEMGVASSQVSPPGRTTQVTPSPTKPTLQVQVREPGVLVQVALAEQPPLFVAHSSTSVQVTPSPVKPLLQAQVREPTVLVQAAFALQPPLFVAHSLMSTQAEPLRVKPDAQVKPQPPVVQVAVEFAGCGHTWHELPHEVMAVSETHC